MNIFTFIFPDVARFEALLSPFASVYNIVVDVFINMANICTLFHIMFVVFLWGLNVGRLAIFPLWQR